MTKHTVAVIGAGRMGSIVAKQLPKEFDKIVIDSNQEKAKQLADNVGGLYSDDLKAASAADVIAVVLPASVITPTMIELSKIAKAGTIILNMATSAVVDQEIIANNPKLHFVEAKIIGHAISMGEGAPCFVVLNTKDEAIFKIVQQVLAGYEKVIQGDTNLVPVINEIGSREGIRAAVQVRKQLRQYQIPKEWEDIVIYTVCAGTMRSYVKNDLGHFAQALADKFENE